MVSWEFLSTNISFRIFIIALVGFFSLDFFNVQSFSSGCRSLRCRFFSVADENIQFAHIAHRPCSVSLTLVFFSRAFYNVLGIFLTLLDQTKRNPNYFHIEKSHKPPVNFQYNASIYRYF